MDHGRFGPRGAAGGADGGLNGVAVRTGGGDYVPPHLSKDQDIALAPGDVVTVDTPGGGGYGDPLRRDPSAVARDVRRGYYDAATAEARFGVVLGPDGEPDTAATARRRGGTA
jgi:N-methylhydantoinase B